MAKQPIETLTVIIPTINEASRLPLLLADLKKCSNKLEVNVVDGGSTDLTVLSAKIAGANVINSLEVNRGLQMKIGAENAKNKWLLFLHADCRLDPCWSKKVFKLINQHSSRNYCWHFDFKVKGSTLALRLLEIAVNFRSILLKEPYGDQGLLIHKSLYEKAGGISPLCIMEDIDFITRVRKISFVIYYFFS